MKLSAQQLQALKAWIDENAARMGDEETAAALNAPADPAFWVWRNRITKRELVESTGPDDTRFNWTGNGFLARTVSEQLTWLQLFDTQDALDPSAENVRQALMALFSGDGPAADNRAHLLAVCRRQATVAELLFSVGDGTPESPARMILEGAITAQHTIDARNS